jgi:extracellular elastinolytic metalloproteinase
MLFETLESRQLLSYVPGEFPALDAAFLGNHLPPRDVRTATEGTFLTAPSAGNPKTIGLNYLSQNAASFGLTASDFTHVIETSSYASSGITHVYLQQTYNGIPISDANASVHIAANGQVISADANFVPNLPHLPNPVPTIPDMPAEGAVARFAELMGVELTQPITKEFTSSGPQQKTVLSNPEISADPIKAELQYAYRPNGDITLGWRVNVTPLDQDHWWDIMVSAEFDENYRQVISLTDWTWDLASYEVFERPVQDPLYATPFGARTIAVDPHDAEGGSPLGWHDANGVDGPEFLDTRGNNISAQEDIDADNTGGARPTSPTLDFTAPLVLPAAPATYRNASIINAFYWTNLAHDVTYAHGFDEISGNFQLLNYTGEGLGNDRVEVDVHDGGTVFNATMQTPPDGISGRMSMGIFPVPAPGTDSALDGTILVHEYGHGVSNRLTGGPANANALTFLQSRGMGEGWSDWLAMLMTAKPTDTAGTPRTTGDWVLNAPGVGVRRQPYSFDMSIDTLTLGDYNGDLIPGANATEVHNSGEIWASALWDLTRLLIDKYGYNFDLYESTGGMQVALDIVLMGMKLQPANPTFTQARDAILAADQALYGGENTDEIWEAFARRGFGLSARAEVAPSLGPGSLVVVEAFDRPTPLARISGTVFQDLNGNNRRDASDAPLQGWTVYVDANNNAQFDASEKNAVSGVDGSYSLSFFSSAGSARVRQVVQPGFSQVLPANNGGYVVSIPARGQVATGIDFGNRQLPGQVSGIKWNDLNADGIRDVDDPTTPLINEGEPGLKGVVIYVDLNNDGRIGILEPAAVTDIQGRYTIKNIQPGTYTIRELNGPGFVQTFPDPADPVALGAHVGVIVTAGVTILDINFGNSAAIDFGDAPTAAQTGFPASYPTTLALQGARHGILPGFGLGPAADGEPDGQPTLAATGDDNTGAVDDEDGVVIPGLTPGLPATVVVTVSNGGFSAGLLQGWIDWNRDGDWDDANEQVVRNRLLREQAAPHLVSFDVPDGITLGPVYARFRYGYESNLGPTGPAAAGEVEDYRAVVLDENPVALPDCFGGGGTIATDPINGAACVPIVIKQGSAATTIDVLANDFGTINGGPFLIPGDFPTFTTGDPNIVGDEGVVNFVNGTLEYTPHPDFIGRDEFLYRIQDGDVPPNVSSPVKNTSVALHVTAADPKAVDDTRTINAATADDGLARLPAPDLLANDIKPAGTRIVANSLVRITPGPVPVGELVQVSADGQTLDFRSGNGFRGTVIYQYQIDDNDSLTDPSTARVTIQVVDVVAGVPQPAPTHWAQLEIQYLDLAGQPIVGVFPGDEFIVRVVATDIGPTNLDTDPANPPAFVDRTQRGVEAAFLDLLYDKTLATPVSSVDNPLEFRITFDGKLGTEAIGGTQVATSAVQAAPAPTATAFNGAPGDLDPADDTYTGLNLVFTSGPLSGQRVRITDYQGGTVADPNQRRFIFENGSFSGAPVAGNTFRIEAPLYNQNQNGALNTPAIGAIDELGGVHADANPPIFFTGAGPNTVFSARFRANNPGDFDVIGDPADRLLNDGINPPLDTRIFLANFPNPQPNELIPLTDEQVFLKSPGPLSIAALGAEAEFSNLRNPLDVNDDTFVSPIDALAVINSLTSGGSRQVSQYMVAAGGQLPGGYVDTSRDGFVSPIDALLVINFLNGDTLADGEGEAFVGADEGEGESAADGPSGAEAALAFTTLAEDEPEGEVSEEDLCDVPLPVALHSIFSNLAEHLSSLAHSSGGVDPDEIGDVVSDAVDDLLSRLECEWLFDCDPFGDA